MLERASACLEHGSRRFLRSRTLAIRNRRMLHSAFWHHGRSDLDLASWWTYMLQQLPTEVSCKTKEQGYRHSGDQLSITDDNVMGDLFLDFLYPVKALVLLQRASTHTAEGWVNRHSRTLPLAHYRPYSSTALVKEKDVNVKPQAKDVKQLQRDESAEDVAEGSIGWTSEGIIRWRHQTMTGKFTEQVRTKATLAEAVALLDEASEKDLISLTRGSGALLKRAIDVHRWDCALRVFKKYIKTVTITSSRSENPLWDLASKRMDLKRDMSSLLAYIAEEVKSPDSDLVLLREFTTRFLHRAINSQIPLIIEHRVVEVFERLVSLSFVNSELFEKILIKQLNKPNLQLHNQDIFVAQLYGLYRLDQDFHPSRKLLMLALAKACEEEAAERRIDGFRIDDIVNDWRSTQGELDLKALGLLLLHYARSGDADKVHSYFDELRRTRPENVSIKFIYPLLNVHAQRAEVQKVHEQFKLIREEYAFEPDRRCWNILLHAHAKVDDIDGAFQVYHDMVSQGIEPDGFTLAPLMSLYARRGDVDAIDQLWQIAVEKHIPGAAPMIGSRILAYIRDDDIGTAEEIATDATEIQRIRPSIGSLTDVWNHILAAYALQNDSKSAMRVFRYMQAKGMELNSMTYAGLLQSLTMSHQTDAAFKILYEVMPKSNIPVLAFHYDIVIRGYIHQDQLETALEVYKIMKKKDVRPTISTKALLMRITAGIDRKRAQELGLRSKDLARTRLVDSEALLAEFMQGFNPSDVAAGQPRVGLRDTPLNQAYPAAYFQNLIAAYGSDRAFQFAEDIFNNYAYTKKHLSDTGVESPISILHALMSAYLRTPKFDEVERCWQLILNTANKFARVKPLHTSLRSDFTSTKLTSAEQANGLTVQESGYSQLDMSETAAVASARRDILAGPLALYLKSLAARSHYDEMQPVVSSLLAEGFTLTHQTWNLYIQLLSESGDVVTAFTLCEKYLMPQWPGWKKRFRGIKPPREKGPQEVMDSEPLKINPKAVYPKYRTMVMLTAAFRTMKRKSKEDFGDGGETVSLNNLELLAPKTVKAVSTLPQLDDKLQREFLRPKRIKHLSRSISVEPLELRSPSPQQKQT